MDVRVLKAIDVLADAGRMGGVVREAGTVVLQTPVGSEVLIEDLGGFLLVTKVFTIGLERATIETVVVSEADMEYTVTCLVELEKRNLRT